MSDFTDKPVNDRSVSMAEDIRYELQEFVNANAEHYRGMDFFWVNKLIEHVLHKSAGLFVGWGLDSAADDLEDIDSLDHTLTPEQVEQVVRWLRLEAAIARAS